MKFEKINAQFENMNIGLRLSLGFGIVLALMLAMALAGVVKMSQLNAGLDGIVNDNDVQIKAIMEMRHNVMAIGQAVRNMALMGEAEQMSDELDRIKDERDEYNANTEILQRLASGDGKELLGRIGGARAAADPVTDQVAALLKQGKGPEAIALLSGQGRASQKKWIATLDEMVRVQEKRADSAVEAAHKGYRLALLVALAISAVAITLGVGTGWGVTRSITMPLHEAVALARRVAKGDLSGEVAVRTRDEAGQLMQALKEMHGSLVEIVTEVRKGTDMIASASHEIADGNLDLSSRTEQQASSLEETASSMEELMSTVKANAEHARQADLMARGASDVAMKGGAVVAQVVERMAAINASAHKIVDIISVIDGIAFQTNILALNAAVEAARAGEQGRGFAVVASEVRSLAQRSATAAKEIKTLIDASVQRVEQGNTQVDRARTTMTEVVDAIQRVTLIMGDISTSSQEQASGVAQVGEAIAQIDEATQKNAALVEQMAAAASGLKSLANEQVQAVAVFKLGADHPHAALGPARIAAIGLAR